MARSPRQGRRTRRRDALVYALLEHVSRDLLERHPDVVPNFIGRNAGIYALYRKNRLYHVGLATALRGRLRAHGKNRHGGNWDSFSIYLTIKDQHLREIEAMMLRLASPSGCGATALSDSMGKNTPPFQRPGKRRASDSIICKVAGS